MGETQKWKKDNNASFIAVRTITPPGTIDIDIAGKCDCQSIL